MITFHYPDVAGEQARRETRPYLLREPSEAPALQRADFKEVLSWVERTGGIVLASDPEVLGDRDAFRAARKRVRSLGGLLWVLADLEEERVEGLFAEERLRSLALRVAGGRSIQVSPISESPHENLEESCCAPGEDSLDLFLRQKASAEEIARELLRAELYAEGYPVFVGSGHAEGWTEVLWMLEIARRLESEGFDAALLEDPELERHQEHSIHSYAEDDLLAAYLLRSRYPTHRSEVRDAFLERIRERNPRIAALGEELLHPLEERRPLESAESAREFAGEVAFWLASRQVALYQVSVPGGR